MPARTACDTCKRRKVKCDLVDPCSNCRISRLTCEYTTVPRKRGRKSTRAQAPDEENAITAAPHQGATQGPTQSPAQERGQASKRLRQQENSDSNPEHSTDGLEDHETGFQGGELPGVRGPQYHNSPLVQLGTQPQRLSAATPQSTVSRPINHPAYASDSTLPLTTPDRPHGSPLASRRPFATALLPPLVFTSQAFLSSVSYTDNLTNAEPYSAVVARRIRESLAELVNRTIASGTIVDVIHKCVDLFIQYLFSNTPVIHEPTVREEAALFHLGEPADFYEQQEHDCWQPRVSKLRSFVNIAALCAGTLAVLPDSIMPEQYRTLIPHFLDAARAMLGLYEEYDLEHPDSTSLTARLWLSSALQNTTGRTGLAWQYLWQASLLAQSLQLFDEEAVRPKPPIESHLLRMCFWQLYSADNAASAFGGRAFVLQKSLFHGDLTLLDRGEHDARLLEPSSSLYALDFENRLLTGFTLKHRLWAAASEFLLAVRSHTRQEQYEDETPSEQGGLRLAHLTRLYLTFAGLMDDIPLWLQHFDSSDGAGSIDAGVLSYQKTCFYVQRINLMSTFYSLHIVMLKRSIEHGVVACMGLENQPLPLAIKEVDMVNDLLKELHAVPFVCYKVQGEAAVERIRYVGASLLELKQTTQINLIKTRVNVLFKKLLDFLAKLNSKASDELVTGRV